MSRTHLYKLLDRGEIASSHGRLLLSMAMFVLVVDTSLMNVSIASVVHDLGTTVSDVQAAIALEALVSAAFILIGSKVGDLFGRKRAYVALSRRGGGRELPRRHFGLQFGQKGRQVGVAARLVLECDAGDRAGGIVQSDIRGVEPRVARIDVVKVSAHHIHSPIQGHRNVGPPKPVR